MGEEGGNYIALYCNFIGSLNTVTTYFNDDISNWDVSNMQI